MLPRILQCSSDEGRLSAGNGTLKHDRITPLNYLNFQRDSLGANRITALWLRHTVGAYWTNISITAMFELAWRASLSNAHIINICALLHLLYKCNYKPPFDLFYAKQQKIQFTAFSKRKKLRTDNDDRLEIIVGDGLEWRLPVIAGAISALPWQRLG